jgi:3-hydroxyacyl-CoA dehydrogenase
MRVTIIGSGLMGRGIGTRVVTGGNDLELIDNDPQHAAGLAEELDAKGGGSATAIERGLPSGARSWFWQSPTAPSLARSPNTASVCPTR